MDASALYRLALIYVHLLLCVFALHQVLATDAAVLRGRLSAALLAATHRRVVWLLGGLWISGLSIAAIDLNFDLSLLAGQPKLIAKLSTVAVLTLNGVLLQRWCFPRLVAARPLGAAERSALMLSGAVSTCSWLMAAFFGIADPLKRWPALDILALYGAALGLAAVAALMLDAALRRWGRRACVERKFAPQH